eukprot:3228120-Rhodomonas_salina.1
MSVQKIVYLHARTQYRTWRSTKTYVSTAQGIAPYSSSVPGMVTSDHVGSQWSSVADYSLPVPEIEIVEHSRRGKRT